MKISVIHPSRGRPQQDFATARKWMVTNQRGNRIEYILSIDQSDPLSYHYSVLFSSLQGTWFADLEVITNDNKSAIEAINNASKIATGDLLVVISDDFDCPEHWDTLLFAALDGKSDFCAKTNDGLQPTLITMPVMDRVYYERYGYVYHPDYQHMHADEELTCVAVMTGKYIKLDLRFEHLHYTTGKTKRDDLNVRNDATWAHGQATLDRHALNNFGIESPVLRREDIVWK